MQPIGQTTHVLGNGFQNVGGLIRKTHYFMQKFCRIWEWLKHLKHLDVVCKMLNGLCFIYFIIINLLDFGFVFYNHLLLRKMQGRFM